MQNAQRHRRVGSRHGGPRRVGRLRALGGLALATALALGALGAVAAPLSAAPASAEECPVTGCPTPAPPADGSRAPSPAPGDDTTDAPTPTPDPTATPAPTDTPTPTPTPTPDPTGSPTPTPTATATPTPDPSTPTPAPSAAPADDVPLAVPDLGSGPAIDPAEVARASQLASDLAAAQEALASASEQSRAADRQQEQAQAVADALDAQATAAAKRAASSAAAAAAVVRAAVARGSAGDPLAAALSGKGDLLGKLGAVDRMRALSTVGARTIRAASADARAAETLRKRADGAAAAVAAVDVAASRQTVTEAQTRVDLAVAALAAVPITLSADTGWRTLTVDPSLIPAGWTLPVRGPLTDGFGPRPSRPAGTALFHPGDDIGAACGSTIVAAAAGTVLAAGPNGSYGNFVLIDHGGGVQTAYGHIRDGGIGVAVGQQVAAGQAIAQVGSTGASTGCHLHLEVRVNGLQIDPLPFLAARGVAVGVR